MTSAAVPAPRIMGILNVTPDSFSDGGRFTDPDRALEHVDHMVGEGAEVIDVGGESSRPGADPISVDEQLRRTEPILQALRRDHPGLTLSIDTRSAEVARRAIAAGARMVNDISALGDDPQMASVVAEEGVDVILMHMQGTPRDMQKRPRYDDVVAEVRSFLEQRLEWAVSQGIARERILIDPGIGFGKTVDHNLQLLAHLAELATVAPVVLGTSRKSFIDTVTGLDYPSGELTGTIVTHAVGLLAGVHMLRVHDVREARQVLRMCQALTAARGGG